MPAPCLPPKPPPMYSVITRTCSLSSPKRRASSRRASNMPCVEIHAVSSSPSQRRDGGMRLERRLQVGRRLARELDPDVGGRQRGVRVAAHLLERVLA